MNSPISSGDTMLLTPEQAAAKLQISVRKIHQFVRDGKLPCVQISRKVRMFTEAQLREFIESQTVHAPNKLDKKSPARLPFPRKGGAKSVEDSVTDLGKEIRSLCR